MARLFIHKDIENYFHVFDAAANDPQQEASVVKLYEAGKVILLQGLRVEYDAAFLASVEFPSGVKALKKFKSVSFVKDYFERGAFPEELLDQCFKADRGRLRYFAEQVRGLNDQLTRIAKRFFPGYRHISPRITWRLTETLNENLHFDVYNDDLPDHHLRLFVNLDVVPRIWHTSFTLEHALANHLEALDPDFIRTATPGRICWDLCFAIFGGLEVAGREGAPKHIGFFDPGDVWLVDSRKISHQIFFGRRAVSTEFAVAVDSMDDPSSHYYALVERYRKRFLEAGPSRSRELGSAS
jgi:hypothetical protein